MALRTVCFFNFGQTERPCPCPIFLRPPKQGSKKEFPETRRSTIGHLVKCDAYMSLLAGGKKQKVPPNKIPCKYMQIPIEMIICGGHISSCFYWDRSRARELSSNYATGPLMRCPKLYHKHDCIASAVPCLLYCLSETMIAAANS